MLSLSPPRYSFVKAGSPIATRPSASNKPTMNVAKCDDSTCYQVRRVPPSPQVPTNPSQNIAIAQLDKSKTFSSSAIESTVIFGQRAASRQNSERAKALYSPPRSQILNTNTELPSSSTSFRSPTSHTHTHSVPRVQNSWARNRSWHHHVITRKCARKLARSINSPARTVDNIS